MPGFIPVLGTANASATVTLWNEDGSYATTSRRNGYFWGELALNNNSGPLYKTVTTTAVLNNGSSPDIVSSPSGKAFLAKSPEPFGYDLDGNLTSDGRWNYTWDAENRLIKVESLATAPTGSKRRLEFAYDFQGRRIWAKVTNLDTSAVLSENKFLYDGWNAVAELNAGNNSVIRSYVWGLDLSGSMQGAGGVGGLLKVTYNGTQTTNCFVAYDGNGNVSGLVDAANANVLAQYEYGPFGEVLRATGPMARANPFRFSTEYQDDETDLLYYGYRYYSASTGRWLSRDPIGENGGASLYAFNGNDGIGRWDYLGWLVGTVNVIKNNQLPWYDQAYKFGWQIELDWRPPLEWNDARNACIPCRRAVWVQDRIYYVKYYWPWGPDVYTGWGVDWDENNFSGSALEWVAGWPSSGNSWMHDEPQVSPSYRVNTVFFMAKARVKCTEGSDKGKEYATVTWFYLAPLPLVVPGVPFRVTVGGILSIE